ncbi:hypothetical protein BDY24DRAFT_367972 [Mrakia frigida]|uniref:zinc finger MYND domain-containing protein n=1 Tax=Mrakia frigida TaxID=29902 RepID=UPI003FCBFFC7
MSKDETVKLDDGVGEHIEFLMGISNEQQKAYVEDFSSKFLPSLIRTIVSEKGFCVPNSYLNILYLACSFKTASFSRFVRNFPDEACALYLTYSGSLGDVRDILDVMMQVKGGPRNMVQLFKVVVYTVLGLCTNLPASKTFPSLPPKCKTTLLAVASRFENEPHLRASLKAKGSWEAYGLDLLVSMAEGLGDGEEMMACSRCLGVRYCSKEHQKADWKSHKPLCFKPTW